MHADPHTPDEILNALRFGVDYTFTIKVRTLEIEVRPLSITERVRIVNMVNAEMSEKPEPERNSLTESALLAMHTIARATTTGIDDKREPKLPTAVLGRLTNEELLAIYKAYSDGCDRLDPSTENLTQSHLDALVEAAKKNLLELAVLPRPHLEKLAQCLATLAGSHEASTSGG